MGGLVRPCSHSQLIPILLNEPRRNLPSAAHGIVTSAIMAKARGVDAKLSRLRELRREPVADGHIAELRQALGDASSLVAEAAASTVGERDLSDLTADLVAAFDRFMIEPIDTDPRCRAKIAIVEALNKVDYQRDD